MSTIIRCTGAKLLVREDEKAEKLEEIAEIIGCDVTFEEGEEDFSRAGLVAVEPYLDCEAWPCGYHSGGDDVFREVLMACEPGSSIEYFNDDEFLFTVHVRNGSDVASECEEPVPSWRRGL